MSRRVAIMPVSAQLLLEALRLPESARVDAMQYDLGSDTFLLRIECPDFDEVPTGCLIPKAAATYRLVDGKAEFVGWEKR